MLYQYIHVNVMIFLYPRQINSFFTQYMRYSHPRRSMEKSFLFKVIKLPEYLAVILGNLKVMLGKYNLYLAIDKNLGL